MANCDSKYVAVGTVTSKDWEGRLVTVELDSVAEFLNKEHDAMLVCWLDGGVLSQDIRKNNVTWEFVGSREMLSRVTPA